MATLPSHPDFEGVRRRESARRPEITKRGKGSKTGALSLAHAQRQEDEDIQDRSPWDEVAHRDTPSSAQSLVRLCMLGDDQGLLAMIENMPGLDLNQHDSDGDAPLHQSCAVGHPGCLQALLDHGADPNAKPPHGYPALHCAAASAQNCEQTMRLLIDAGAELEGRSEDGLTPFLVSCHARNLQAALALLRLGANRWAMDPLGRGAMALADQGGYAFAHSFGRHSPYSDSADFSLWIQALREKDELLSMSGVDSKPTPRPRSL